MAGETKKTGAQWPRQSRWILRVAAPGHPVGFLWKGRALPGSGGGGASPPWLPPLPYLALATHPLNTDHPWSLSRSHFPGYITPPNGTFPGGLSRSSRDRLFRNTAQVSKLNDLPWSPPADPLRYETGFLSRSSFCPHHSPNGNAVVYLFLRSTKLVLTWCTALHGIIRSRSSFSYARMLLHAIFK